MTSRPSIGHRRASQVDLTSYPTFVSQRSHPGPAQRTNQGQNQAINSVSIPPSRAHSPTQAQEPPHSTPLRPVNLNHPDIAQPHIPSHHKPKQRKNTHAQKSLDGFWHKFNSFYPGKPYSILPQHIDTARTSHPPKSSSTSPAVNTPIANRNALAPRPALASYEEARAACQAKVEKIRSDCIRLNQKYRDPHFDIEADFRKCGDETPFADCLMGLLDHPNQSKLRPQSVKRVSDIFRNPQFFVDGATASDVRQGREGDCWFMSAVATLSNKEDLISKVCVARDEKVGVYGFVFHRDGEWTSTVIDDKLYLTKEDFHDGTLEREKWLELFSGSNNFMVEAEYAKTMQTGSRALYFAQCSDENETWLPLLEKAYAKTHGDYNALESGFVGEGLEDLTGGVTSELFSTDILDKEKFWNEELMQVNKQFLFGCGQMGGKYGQRNGILEKHAYSIMEAREINGTRLLKLRNPWGYNEWRGAWSDGSPQWTAEWMTALNHTFGDDGLFWISYEDLLFNYQHFDRTRLFGSEWSVTQQWTSVTVPWSSNYLDTRFKVTLTKKSSVVIVLSQLDDRYFRGLEGQYDFQLQFRVHEVGATNEDYIVRSNRPYFMKRSVSTELELEAGQYYVLMKIIAKRYHEYPTVEEVVRGTCQLRREKLLSLGLSYDLAHAKGQFHEIEQAKHDQRQNERRRAKRDEAKRIFEHKALEVRKRKLRDLKIRQKQDEHDRIKMVRQLEQQKNLEVEEAEMQNRFEQYNISREPQEYDPSAAGSLVSPDFMPSGPIRRTSIPLSSSTGPRAQTLPSRAGARPPSLSVSSKPGSPFLPSVDRSVGPLRRNTLTVSSANVRPTSPTPDIRVQRASLAPTGRLSLSDISDDGLSWDSELDGPDSDDENDNNNDDFGPEDSYGDSFDADNHNGNSAKPPTEEEDESTTDPWNAVVVVGLRVYSKDPSLTVHTHHPGQRARHRRRNRHRRRHNQTSSDGVNDGALRQDTNGSTGVGTDNETASDCGSSVSGEKEGGYSHTHIRYLDVDDNSKDASGEILSPIREAGESPGGRQYGSMNL